MVSALFLPIGGVLLLGVFGGIFGAGEFRRDEMDTRPVIFKLDAATSGAFAHPHGGLLQVHASPERDNETAVFSHPDWTVDSVGTLGGFSSSLVGAAGILFGNFTLPSIYGSKIDEPVTGQWMTVGETAEPKQLAAFNYLVDMLASASNEQHQKSLEEMLEAIVKANLTAMH